MWHRLYVELLDEFSDAWIWVSDLHPNSHKEFILRAGTNQSGLSFRPISDHALPAEKGNVVPWLLLAF